MLRVRFAESTEAVEISLSQITADFLASLPSAAWFDIESNDDAFIEAALNAFECHPLAIKDAMRLRHPPKVEHFDDQLFILYRGIASIPDDLVFEPRQVAFFIADHYLVTFHRGSSKGIELVQEDKHFQQWLKTPLNLACKIMHLSGGLYLEAVLQFESTLAEMEDTLLNNGNDQTLIELTTYRGRLLKLMRVFNYLSGVSTFLMDAEKNGISLTINSESYHLINDLDDRFDRLNSLARMHYDICGDLINGYLSITSHQLNNTMRVLTVITAVFVPLSFLAGLYGMNFEHIPELHWKHGYFVLLGVMLLLATSLIWVFRRKRWI